MNIQYHGSRDLIVSVSNAWNNVFQSGESLYYIAKEDQTAHRIEEITVSEGAFDPSKPLGFGEWRFSLSNSRVRIEGAGISEAINAIYAFVHLIEKSKQAPIPSGYVFAHTYTVFQKPFHLNKKEISAYRIFYCGSETATEKQAEDFYRYPPERQAASDLANFIGRECGIDLRPIQMEQNMAPENAIVVAPFADETEAKHYGDWKIETKGSTLFIFAHDICGWEGGVSCLCNLLKKTESPTFPLSYCGSLQKREEYENDPNAFLPCYSGLISEEIPLSFEEKAKKLSSPSGEPFIIAHRGEHSYYPENSLEASLSAWRCGADSTEVDLGLTRDGIFVLMHDDTLSRTTDVAEKMGKNGLPDSPLLSQWSLAELRQLRLKDSHGRQTDFIIPTLEELFVSCDGRIFLHLDKKFDYLTDIFPLMRKHKTYRCLYLCNHIDLEGIAKNRNAFCKEGVILPSLLRIRQQKLQKLKQNLEQVLEKRDQVCPAVVFINDYGNYLPHHKKLIRQYKGKLRIASWMMWETDSPCFWQEADDLGFNVFMTNFPIRLKRHFSDKKY